MNNSQIWFSSWTAHRMKTRGEGTILRQKRTCITFARDIPRKRKDQLFYIFFFKELRFFYQMENRRSEGLKNNNTCYLNLGIYFRQDSFILHSCLYFKPGGHKFQLFQTFKHFKGFASSSSMIQVNLLQLLFPLGSICCCCWKFWMTEWMGAESVEVFIRS